jgi:hypothetical protein
LERIRISWIYYILELQLMLLPSILLSIVENAKAAIMSELNSSKFFTIYHLASCQRLHHLMDPSFAKEGSSTTGYLPIIHRQPLVPFVAPTVIMIARAAG